MPKNEERVPQNRWVQVVVCGRFTSTLLVMTIEQAVVDKSVRASCGATRPQRCGFHVYMYYVVCLEIGTHVITNICVRSPRVILRLHLLRGPKRGLHLLTRMSGHI